MGLSGVCELRGSEDLVDLVDLGPGRGFAHWRNAAKEQMSKGAKWSLVGRIAGLGVCGIGVLLAKIGDLRGGQK